MEIKTIQKYKKYSTAKLIQKAQIEFNKFIRNRDEGKPCINCGNYRKLQAGHFYAAGQYSALRYDEDNCHGECLQCNYYNSQSHAQCYRMNLIIKIGQHKFDKLVQRADISKRTAHKWDRFTLIEIIETYKKKNKQCEK